MSTQAQIAANQRNAQLSTGPTSEDGREKSSRNALKTGLTGRTVLLPSEDAELYEAHLAEFKKRFEPVGEEETALVQSLADTAWRLARIPGLETGIFALGRIEFADLFPDEEPARRNHLIDSKTLLVYNRQLNNLSVQENRLWRQREKDTAALRQLQEARKAKSRQQLTQAAQQYIQAVNEGWHHQWDPQKFGFEFTVEQVELRAVELQPHLFADWMRAQEEQCKERGRKTA
jgi:hypothetical protein